MNLHST